MDWGNLDVSRQLGASKRYLERTVEMSNLRRFTKPQS